MTPTASLTCAWTALSNLVSTSSARKASSLAWSSRQTWRKLGLGVVAGSWVAVATPPLTAAPLDRDIAGDVRWGLWWVVVAI